MFINLDQVKVDLEKVVETLVKEENIKENDIFVIGLSTSEVVGSQIGKNSNQTVGDAIIQTALSVLQAKGIYLAVQGCEHINRALVIEESAAEKYQLPIVSVVPDINAGGAGAVAAYNKFEKPVMVEHIIARIGIDIGDTAIGMHIKHVQVPIRLDIKSIGNAHLTALTSRPKKIGGARAKYTADHLYQ